MFCKSSDSCFRCFESTNWNNLTIQSAESWRHSSSLIFPPITASYVIDALDQWRIIPEEARSCCISDMASHYTSGVVLQVCFCYIAAGLHYVGMLMAKGRSQLARSPFLHYSMSANDGRVWKIYQTKWRSCIHYKHTSMCVCVCVFGCFCVSPSCSKCQQGIIGINERKFLFTIQWLRGLRVKSKNLKYPNEEQFEVLSSLGCFRAAVKFVIFCQQLAKKDV